MPFYADPAVVSGGGGGGGGVSVTVDSTTTIYTPSAPLDWAGRVAIKRRPSDDALVMVYRRGSKHEVNDGGLYIRFSDDDGVNWTAENTALASDGGGAISGFPMNPSTLSAGQDAGEPWLYVASNGDLVLHMWRVDYGVSTNGTWQSRSTDGGLTWSTSAQVTFSNTGTYFGNPISSSIVFSTDDDFVHPSTNDIYAGARAYVGGADGDPSVMFLIKSTDDGATWARVSSIMGSTEGGTGGQEVGLEYLGSNTIIALLRDNPHTHAYKRVSSDLGATWGALTDVTSTMGIAGRQRVYTGKHLRGEASWETDTSLIALGFVHQVSGSSQTRRNCVWVSTDSGSTWSTPYYIDSSTEDAGYGDIFYRAATGKYVVVSYYGTLASAVLKQYVLTITGI
jgi:hypothetical protein